MGLPNGGSSAPVVSNFVVSVTAEYNIYWPQDWAGERCHSYRYGCSEQRSVGYVCPVPEEASMEAHR